MHSLREHISLNRIPYFQRTSAGAMYTSVKSSHSECVAVYNVTWTADERKCIHISE